MISAIELAAQIDNTRHFILSDPVLLDIRRPLPAVSDGAGGRRKPDGEPPLAASRTFRLIPAQDKTPLVTTFNGAVERPEYVILGLPDFEFVRGDIFEWKGWVWRINAVHPSPDYESKGDVVRDHEVA